MPRAFVVITTGASSFSAKAAISACRAPPPARMSGVRAAFSRCAACIRASGCGTGRDMRGGDPGGGKWVAEASMTLIGSSMNRPWPRTIKYGKGLCEGRGKFFGAVHGAAEG